jgi:hypothetical protein
VANGGGKLRQLWNSPWRAAIFALGGAVAGVAYFQLVGCNGTCPLTGSAWRSATYFAAVAAVVGFPARTARK